MASPRRRTLHSLWTFLVVICAGFGDGRGKRSARSRFSDLTPSNLNQLAGRTVILISLTAYDFTVVAAGWIGTRSTCSVEAVGGYDSFYLLSDFAPTGG